jgi:hypothetical protein
MTDLKKKKHEFSYTTDEVMINPIIPRFMDNLDIQLRNEEHLQEWFNVPYIETHTHHHEPYQEYVKRLEDMAHITIENIEDYEQRKFNEHKKWFKAWESGVRYDVRCLDGGAWDRTSSKGMFGNLDQAIKLCKELIK